MSIVIPKELYDRIQCEFISLIDQEEDQESIDNFNNILDELKKCESPQSD